MRGAFLVTGRWGIGPVAAALAAAGMALAGCATPLSERADPRLPGLPVVARRGDAGPVHRQRLVSVAADRVVLVERLAADGRPPSVSRVTLDRHGRVLARTALPPSTALPAPPPGIPLPAHTGDGVVTASRRAGTVVLRLEGGGRSVVLARLPDAGAVTLGPAVLAAGAPAPLAVVPWRARHGAIDVEGLTVLDLRRGRAELEVEAGLAAHLRRDFPVARRRFEAAARLDPTYADAAYDLACALVHLGDRPGALTWLARAFALAPHRLRRLAAEDPDLDPLRGDPAFRRIAGPGADARRPRMDDRP